MNIVINSEEANQLFYREFQRYFIGSRLYGTDNKNSDIDILVIYNSLDPFLESNYNVQHQFQYKDIEYSEIFNKFGKPIDYIFTSRHQFFRNLYSGDSTINADVVLFYNLPYSVRTFNIIKAYIGFAKRDIKFIGKDDKDRYFHARRGLYTAECLLMNKVPQLSDIQSFKNDKSLSKQDLTNKEQELRIVCNKLFEQGELPLYPEVKNNEYNPLLVKLLNSKNIKEFHYG